MKTKNMDELCNKPAGSFKKFTQSKELYLKNLEEKRKARIRASRTSHELWMAA